jgi:hypothetical protein
MPGSNQIYLVTFFFHTLNTSCRMVKTSLPEKIGKYRWTQRWHIPFKVDPWFFLFFLILSGFVLNFLGWGCVIFTENIPLCYCLQSVLLKTWIFSVTKDNNGVQIFPIYPNNNSMSAISRENVQIILISYNKVYIKVQLVLSVWKKTSLSKSGYPQLCRQSTQKRSQQ